MYSSCAQSTPSTSTLTRLFFFTRCWNAASLAATQQRMQTLEKTIASLEAQLATAMPWLEPWRWPERSHLTNLLWDAKAELMRRRNEVPDNQAGSRAGPDGLLVAQQGTIALKRRRHAPFGWLQVELPIEREVYETVGTFSISPSLTDALDS